MNFTGEPDIRQQVVERYGKSIAPQHLHLREIASRFCCKSPAPTPRDYFVAIINSSKTDNDTDAVCGISSLLALVLPLLPNKSINMSMVAKATRFVVDLLDSPSDCLQVTSERDLVKCLGLLLELCNLDNWNSVQLGFPTLIKYAIDKHPKVRKCAQDCVVKAFKSFQSTFVKKRASKLVLETFKTYMPSAVGSDGSKVDEQLEVCHKFDLLKLLIPYLPSEVISEAIEGLQNSISDKFSPPLMMHVLDVMEEILQFFESESELTVIDKAKIVDKWSRHYSLVIGFITGLLAYKKAIATRASNILRRMLTRVDLHEDLYLDQLVIVDSLCDGLVEVLSTHSDDKGTPNEHTLAVISDAFRVLGTYMENIFEKLVSFMPVALASGNSCDVKHLRECIGAGVSSMGAESALPLIPISCNATDLTFSNTWFIPILKEYTCLSYLGVFIKTIVPLADSFLEASQKVKNKKSVIRKLQSYAHDCWGLLPSFCRQPYDMHRNFGSLVTLLIPCIKKDAFMLESIAIALQHLVKDNINRSSLDDDESDDEEPPKLPRACYDKEVAASNIEALSSCSEALLRAFTQVFFQVSPEKRAFVKDTIGCLAFVTEYSTIITIFSSSLKLNVSLEKGRVDANRCLLLELALSFDGATSIRSTHLIYDFINECLEEDDDNIQSEAYITLYKILVESSEFMSSEFEQLVDSLLALKSPVHIISLRWRFSCFRALLVHSIEISRDRENTHGVCMLNEILVTLEDVSKEESRKVAEDILRETSSILKKTSSFKRKRAPYYEFIAMIRGHLSASSPCVKSGAVSALSLLISNDLQICHLMPDLVSEILELLDSEDIQVTKSVLGFLKVLVLRLEARDLQMFLADILEELVPWSPVSQHHIKSQMKLIVQTVMRKCGGALPEKYRDFVNRVLKFYYYAGKYVQRSLESHTIFTELSAIKGDSRTSLEAYVSMQVIFTYAF